MAFLTWIAELLAGLAYADTFRRADITGPKLYDPEALAYRLEVIAPGRAIAIYVVCESCRDHRHGGPAQPVAKGPGIRGEMCGCQCHYSRKLGDIPAVY